MTFPVLRQMEVYNILFKPFDPLILKETLNMALQSGKLAKTKEMQSQKATTFIGVLKEIEKGLAVLLMLDIKKKNTIHCSSQERASRLPTEAVSTNATLLIVQP